ncbi:hypothetical protein ACP275_10G107200 [Erythranthe tilingii]
MAGSDIVYLGRAWGHFSTTIFAYTYMDNNYMDNNVNAEGWFDWGDPSKQSLVISL